MYMVQSFRNPECFDDKKIKPVRESDVWQWTSDKIRGYRVCILCRMLYQVGSSVINIFSIWAEIGPDLWSSCAFFSRNVVLHIWCKGFRPNITHRHYKMSAEWGRTMKSWSIWSQLKWIAVRPTETRLCDLPKAGGRYGGVSWRNHDFISKQQCQNIEDRMHSVTKTRWGKRIRKIEHHRTEETHSKIYPMLLCIRARTTKKRHPRIFYNTKPFRNWLCKMW